MWEFKDSSPIYLQIIAIIRTGILNSTYPPGSKLPAVRELALQAGVNPNTMQRALSELERDGLIHTERTNGRFVTEDQTVLQTLARQMAEERISELFQQLRNLGLTDTQIIDMVQNWKGRET
ncbi:MAG: GntR family transcriptional regulator [Lachnospiraceae bacterium]|nr:GntR family transcriptional regulator [Lachnospiraceae bacterium]